jgi:biotin-(acetyl-CoA carboxylase) ligase
MRCRRSGPGVSLKWPNDLVTAAGKLGGILIEMRAESGGPVHVVAGIGLNVALDDQARATVKATGNIADDIRAHCSTVPDRNDIVAALLARLVPALEGFPRHGSRRTSRTGTSAMPCATRKCASKTPARSRAAWRAASTHTARCSSKRRRRAAFHFRRSHGANRS